MDSKPTHVTDASFDSDVLQSDKPVLTDFWAEWCGPCKMIAPILEDIASEYEDDLMIAKVDVDSNPGIAMRYGVQSIPTLILFKNGQEAKRLIGAMSKERLMSQLKPHLTQ
ncbi:MAG: thioredoxin [Anaerolineae bacterium]